jgi:hypothetical protein
LPKSFPPTINAQSHGFAEGPEREERANSRPLGGRVGGLSHRRGWKSPVFLAFIKASVALMSAPAAASTDT